MLPPPCLTLHFHKLLAAASAVPLSEEGRPGGVPDIIDVYVKRGEVRMGESELEALASWQLLLLLIRFAEGGGGERKPKAPGFQV